MTDSKQVRKWQNRRTLAWIFASLALLHAVCAVYYWHPLSQGMRTGAACLLLASFVSALAFGIWKPSVKWIAFGLWIAVETAFFLKTPSAGEWNPLQERSPIVELDGHVATIENYRLASYGKSAEVEQVGWMTKTVDIGQIESVELVIQVFSDWEGLAHAMATFRLSTGEHIAFSVEARVPRNSDYHPVAGSFKFCQLVIIIGDERDVLWKRIAAPQPRRMLIYPLEATKEQTQAYFRSLVLRADDLTRNPHFYQTLRSNCLTTLVDQAPNLKKRIKPFDYRLFVPGLSDELFRELGLIEFDGTREELHERYSIPEKVRMPEEVPDAASWSRQLRTRKS